MKQPVNKKQRKELTVQQKINRRSFISFAALIGLYAAGYEAWRWLYKSPEETADITGGVQKPLRRALNQNELAFRKTFSNDHLVKTYPKSMAAQNVRVNSKIGIDDDDFNPESWMLIINKNDGGQLKLSLKDIKALPKTEIVYDFKCVEGWDQIQYWGGVSFRDFIAHYQLEDETKLNYVGFATPDEGYYVGIDMPSAMHPQTILAYEVNNRSLPMEHGYPLRLIIPVKYGIKNLKRIGTMSFNNERPPDYWAEQGYDYYSGL
ncbi:MAG: molybdopterin-dependent oxidoreductase [Ferruginibacter sp.]